MSTPTFSKMQVLIGATFLLCVIVACFINADVTFASEQYVTDYDEGAALRHFIADVFIGLVFLAALPAALFVFSIFTQWSLAISSEWKVKGEMAKVVRSGKNARRGLLIMFATAMGVTFTGPILGPIPARIGLFESDLPTLYMVGIIFIIAIALFSAAAVTQGAYVLIFPDGKIWYKTHMKLRYFKFNVSDIEFVEESTIWKFDFSTFYLKDGKRTRLFWLFFPPELWDYLEEQEVLIMGKGQEGKVPWAV